MKSLVIYDSYYGNTKLLAETIGKELGNDSRVIRVSDFKVDDLNGVDLLIVGSPILGWKPSEKTEEFLNKLGDLKEIRVCSFDTRVKLFIHGDATQKIAEKLVSHGGILITKPNMFYVIGKEGPLFKGEVERAKEWGRLISTLVTK